MRGVYTASAKVQSITTVGTLFHIETSTRDIEVYRVRIMNPNNNTNDQLEGFIAQTVTAASGGTTIAQGAASVGTTVTSFAPREISDSTLDVSTCTARFGSGILAGTTFYGHEYFAFPSLGGEFLQNIPEEYIKVAAGNGLLITLFGDNPTSSLDLIVQVSWRE